jgi:phenylalanyl-tRNA synthetase beta subunit
LISANRHNDLPQMVYELGTCVSDHDNCDKVSWLVADTDAGFAQARGFAQALLQDLGAESNEISWQSLPEGHGPWLAGRSASISVSGTVIGEIGELDPAVSESFSLKVPMHGAEFDVSALMDCIADPVL